MDESHYLLFVILTVHVQHKQVIAQAADGDACNRERPFDTQHNTTGILARVSEPLPGTQQLLFPHQETRQLRSCANVSAERLQGDNQLKLSSLRWKRDFQMRLSIRSRKNACLQTVMAFMDLTKSYLGQLRDL